MLRQRHDSYGGSIFNAAQAGNTACYMWQELLA